GKDPISQAALEEADIWFETLERYRLGGPREAAPGDLTQFHEIAPRHSGDTPDPIPPAQATPGAPRDPRRGTPRPGHPAPGGAHLVDDAGPLVLRRPSGATATTFDPNATARSILDAASTPLLGRSSKPAVPRVIVDYGALTSRQAQALADALPANAKQRR